MMGIEEMFVFMAIGLFWICLFLTGFTLGRGRLIITSLSFIPLGLGWVFLFIALPDIKGAFTCVDLSDWLIIVVILVTFIITSLGSGYLCEKSFRGNKK